MGLEWATAVLQADRLARVGRLDALSLAPWARIAYQACDTSSTTHSLLAGSMSPTMSSVSLARRKKGLVQADSAVQ